MLRGMWWTRWLVKKKLLCSRLGVEPVVCAGKWISVASPVGVEPGWADEKNIKSKKKCFPAHGVELVGTTEANC